MISPEVGVRFSLKYHHITWRTDCPLGFLTTFYSFTLRYFYQLVQLTQKTPSGWGLDLISAALFVLGR